MRRDRLLLEDILAAADTIATFIEDQSLDSFEGSRLIRSAVVYQLTVIGEAVARLPQDLRDRHKEVPWQDIKGFRNVIVHHYFGIDWEEVWRTVSLRIPILRAQIAAIIATEFPSESGASQP